MATATSSSRDSSLSRRHAVAIWSAAALLSLCPWAQVASASAAVANLPRTDQPLIDEGKVFLLTPEEVEKLTLSERQILLLNQRIQTQNRTAEGFPSFIREGFDVKVVAPGYLITEDGIIFKDYREGTGESPVEGQEVFFNYTGYNESGATIDSSYRQNRPGELTWLLKTLARPTPDLPSSCAPQPRFSLELVGSSLALTLPSGL